MSTAILGVGSRVNHPAYGVGVVTKLHLVAYDVVFVQHGVKTVGKEYDKWEIIDHIPAEENITYTEAETPVKQIWPLKKYPSKHSSIR